MKSFLQQLKPIIICFILILGLSYASAYDTDPWVPMPGVFDQSKNISAPIDTFSGSNIKNGDLTVNTFSANKDAQFNADTFFSLFVRGIEKGTTNSTVAIGSSATPARVTVSGTVTSDKAMTVTGLANGKNFQCDGSSETNCLPHICADKAGNVVFCKDAQPTDLCLDDANDPKTKGVQTTIPQGYWRNSDGTCETIVDVCSNIAGAQPMVPPGYTARNDGTCYSSDSVNATFSITSACNADSPSAELGAFWNTNMVRSGYYLASLHFSKPLPQSTKVDLKVCSSRPGYKAGLFGGKATRDDVETCQGAPHNANTLTYLSYDGGTVYSVGGPYGTVHLSDATPLTYDIPAGTTTFDIPEHFVCSRSDRGSGIMWSYLNELSAQFSPTQTSSLQWNVSLKTVPPICENPAGNFDCGL